MTQQEIEEAIKVVKECESYEYPTPAEERKHINVLIKLATLYLSVMKSGMPKKRHIYDNPKGNYENRQHDLEMGRNQAIDEFTVYLIYLAQKLMEKFK